MKKQKMMTKKIKVKIKIKIMIMKTMMMEAKKI